MRGHIRGRQRREVVSVYIEIKRGLIGASSTSTIPGPCIDKAKVGGSSPLPHSNFFFT
jgi:hypothetical protein